jgi:hypothetical protein
LIVIAWLQPLLMEVKGKQRGESKLHGQVAEHTGGDAGTSGRAAERHGNLREN